MYKRYSDYSDHDIRVIDRFSRDMSALLQAFQLSSHLILQPVALFLLPALRNSFLLVANNSRQLTNVITVSSGSAMILNEYERRSLHIASHSSTPKTVPLKSVLTI